MQPKKIHPENVLEIQCEKIPQEFLKKKRDRSRKLQRQNGPKKFSFSTKFLRFA